MTPRSNRRAAYIRRCSIALKSRRGRTRLLRVLLELCFCFTGTSGVMPQCRTNTPIAGSPPEHTISRSSLRRTIAHRGAAEQLLHGEPHPGNVLSTKDGPLFIDLETCCRGPVEFDLAHVPEEVIEHYPDADQGLLGECRVLVLAMVAAWRWDAGDQFPNGQRVARELVSTLRNGPPWPVLDVLMRRLSGP